MTTIETTATRSLLDFMPALTASDAKVLDAIVAQRRPSVFTAKDRELFDALSSDPEYRAMILCNTAYDIENRLALADVAAARDFASRLAARMSDAPTPHTGDRVLAVGPKKTYETARLDKTQQDHEGLSVVTVATVPWIHDDLTSSGGGGYYVNLPDPSVLVYVGEAVAPFQFWGRGGVMAHGSVQFFAPVRVWRFESEKIW